MSKGTNNYNYNDEIAAINKAVEKADDNDLRRALEKSNNQIKLAPLLLTPRTADNIELLVSPRAIAGQEEALKKIKNAQKKAHTLSPLFLPKKALGITSSLADKFELTSRADEFGLTSRADEFGLTPSTIAAQIDRLRQFEQQRGPKFVDIVEDEAYLSLVAKCQADPFMIMGYQNGHPNLFYESKWSAVGNDSFLGYIYIPREPDLNNRKYTRYPNKFMSNTDGKTIVNLSLHNWAFGMNYWHDKINNDYQDMNRNVRIQMSRLGGISKVESSVEDADFFSISETPKSIPYLVHGSSYSPDTGVIALDEKKDVCFCLITIQDSLVLAIYFLRDKDKYDIAYGGTRKRRRQTKRRQTKRRQTKRRQTKRRQRL